MAIVLPRGTKEYVVVNVSDALGNLLTLSGTTPQYRVLTAAGGEQVTWTTATDVVMKLYCMIDTNLPSLWAASTFRLYCRFTTAPELPILGPYEIEVSAA